MSVDNLFSYFCIKLESRKDKDGKTIPCRANLLFILLYLGAVDTNFLWLFGKSPGFAQIKNPATSEASEIYSADGVLIGRYYNENRTPVKFEDVNPAFWKALIDTEDERFYKHPGIDLEVTPAEPPPSPSSWQRTCSACAHNTARDCWATYLAFACS